MYPVSRSLTLEEDSWIADIRPNDLVIAIHYFGFELSSFPWRQVCAAGAVLLEDCCQALFRAGAWTGSYGRVFSPRKFIGVPDGGILVGDGAAKSSAPALGPAPGDWWAQALEVGLLRRDFDLAGAESNWYERFRQVEATFPLGAFKASELSTCILERGIDYPQMAEARRSNYFALLSDLREYALFTVLEDECVPMGFPVAVPAARRDSILRFLYARQIYPPIHWRLGDSVPPEFAASHRLSASILTLIVDQRYDARDMRRQADCFLEAMRLA